jgi:hypothetical protein
VSTAEDILSEASPVQWLHDRLELIETAYPPDAAAVAIVDGLMAKARQHLAQSILDHVPDAAARTVLLEAAASVVVADGLASLAALGLVRTRTAAPTGVH